MSDGSEADVGVQETITDLGMKAMNASHRMILKVSGGRLLSAPYGMATVELHTTGRTSGQRRSTLLTAPIHEDGRTVLVASKGGDDRDPQWYRNLVAEPDVELTIAGETRAMRARTADPGEKAELWPRITAAYRGYAGYQKRTDRDIPVVICEPRR
ncbi:MAG TPA: nitroreductase/quinone reductase family protein [Iamia sp.]|nr:nitroreductase/quinone reductase family protein [Iamia sp.]HXH57352.1 nitroreductase/quinone reductase family protein [Iamia sp.]